MARIRTIEGRLEIRIRHHAMRFLCLVLFIVSIVGFNNPKQPDGRAFTARGRVDVRHFDPAANRANKLARRVREPCDAARRRTWQHRRDGDG
jgi:hypothetical protein